MKFFTLKMRQALEVIQLVNKQILIKLKLSHMVLQKKMVRLVRVKYKFMQGKQKAQRLEKEEDQVDIHQVVFNLLLCRVMMVTWLLVLVQLVLGIILMKQLKSLEVLKLLHYLLWMRF